MLPTGSMKCLTDKPLTQSFKDVSQSRVRLTLSMPFCQTVIPLLPHPFTPCHCAQCWFFKCCKVISATTFFIKILNAKLCYKYSNAVLTIILGSNKFCRCSKSKDKTQAHNWMWQCEITQEFITLVTKILQISVFIFLLHIMLTYGKVVYSAPDSFGTWRFHELTCAVERLIFLIALIARLIILIAR